MTPVCFGLTKQECRRKGGEVLMLLEVFLSLFAQRSWWRQRGPYLQWEQPWLNALHKTVISQSSRTKRARLLNVNERQRTKLFLKLPIKLLHSRPSLKGMSVLLPLREVIILFLSENNKWAPTMAYIFWSWNLSVARRRGFIFLPSTGHFFFFFSSFSPH